MKNKIKSWVIKELSNNKNEFFVDKIVDDESGICITMSDAKSQNRLSINWPQDQLVSYRNTNESYYLYGLGQTKEKQDLRINFYMIDNSDYVKFIEDNTSPEIINMTANLLHFAIHTVNDCIDIIATESPLIRLNVRT